jgi:hypothetical protein
MRTLLIAVAVLVACGDDTTTSSETSTSTSTSTAAVPTSSSAATTDAESTTADEIDPLVDYQPCGDGCGAGQCITLEGASICGPVCEELGPGYANRCEHSPPLSTLCPYDSDVPGICILGCATAADCPAPGMICVPCPEPFTQGCSGLNPVLGFAGSDSMCAWPNP